MYLKRNIHFIIFINNNSCRLLFHIVNDNTAYTVDFLILNLTKLKKDYKHFCIKRHYRIRSG